MFNIICRNFKIYPARLFLLNVIKDSDNFIFITVNMRTHIMIYSQIVFVKTEKNTQLILNIINFFVNYVFLSIFLSNDSMTKIS